MMTGEDTRSVACACVRKRKEKATHVSSTTESISGADSCYPFLLQV